MRVRRSLKSNFLSGLVIVAPIVVTLFVVRLLVNWSFSVLNPIVEETQLAQFTANDPLLAKGLAAVLILGFITLVGFVAQYSVGRRLFGKAGRVMNFIPFVRLIYSSVHQMANSISASGSRFESVVFVEYPREGVYSIGLVTGDSPAEAEGFAGEPVYNVFFPASPNPTQGKLVLIPESNLYRTDISVARGFQLLMTTGMAEDNVVELDDAAVTAGES